MNFETPCYIVNKNSLDNAINSLNNALTQYWPNSIIGYSYKTNSLPWLVSYFNELGCYSEVVSPDEYNLGKKIGVERSKFIYNGPIKDKETFIEAVNNKCIVNIDSQREIEWLDCCDSSASQLGIRINFDLEKICPGQTQCGIEGGRFGFCLENGEAEKAIKLIQEKGHSVSGIHLHTSTRTRSIEIYKALADKACDISKQLHLELSFIDIGGGFFGGMPDKPSFEEYINTIETSLKAYFDKEKTTLIFEPGISLVGAAIDYKISVVDKKQTAYNSFVVTDGTRLHVDPFMRKTSLFYERENINNNASTMEKQVICGYTCIENDRLYIAEKEKEYSIGEVITIEKVGAYTMCFSPLFIQYFPNVYLYDGSSVKCIRKKWGVEQYINKSVY